MRNPADQTPIDSRKNLTANIDLPITRNSWARSGLAVIRICLGTWGGKAVALVLYRVLALVVNDEARKSAQWSGICLPGEIDIDPPADAGETGKLFVDIRHAEVARQTRDSIHQSSAGSPWLQGKQSPNRHPGNSPLHIV